MAMPAASTAMLREINEQPRSLTATLDAYLAGSRPVDALRALTEPIAASARLTIVASGSSRHAGLAGELMFEDLAGIAVDVEYASEYASRVHRALAKTAVLVISQSGETADTLAALRAAGSAGARTFAISNVAGSTMAREASASMPIMAGVETAIPATKSFTAQLMVLYLLSVCLGGQRGSLSQLEVERRCAEALQLPQLLEAHLQTWNRAIAGFAAAYAGAQSLLYLGRGIHYAIAREGALKMKESSYVPAEGYPSGELKHGPNALVSGSVPLVVLATRDAADSGSVLRYNKTLQLMRDLQAQAPTVLAIATEGDREIASLATHTVFVPQVGEYLLPILEVVPLQLLALHCALLRGVDVDRPRNLVKAVLAE